MLSYCKEVESMFVCKEDTSSVITTCEALCEMVFGVYSATGVGGMKFTCGQPAALVLLCPA